MTGSGPMDDLEGRLRTAVHAEAADVSPEDGSLDTIRTRVRAAHRRRRAAAAGAGALALVVAAVLVPALGDDEQDVTTSNDSTSTTTTSEPPSSTTTTTVPAPPTSDLDQAIWPDPGSSARYDDPVAAALFFVRDFLGYAGGDVSEFHAGEPGAGEVDVLSADEDGLVRGRVVATLTVRQLDGESWFVTSAASDSVQVDSPEPVAAVTSPVQVTGRARGYEGTVAVSVHDRSGGDELGAEPTIAGAGESLEPFSVEVGFEAPLSPVAVVLASTDSGASGMLAPFAALPVRVTADGSPGTGTTPNSPGGPPSAAYEFTSQPLWPFRSQAEADDWLAASAEGHSPWHASADATALFFTNSYLGFAEIDRVTSTDVRATEAWIGVGYEADAGSPSTAAVIHLVRFGPDPAAPWEVVGTRDAALTLDTPAYGSAVSSPVTVGGTITGVDESLHVQVRQLSSPGPIGDACCVPAGGEATPWETSVDVVGATDSALTIVVWSGGHVQDVEVFAITGVHR